MTSSALMTYHGQWSRKSDNDKGGIVHDKNVCIITIQPDIKSNPSPKPDIVDTFICYICPKTTTKMARNIGL